MAGKLKRNGQDRAGSARTRRREFETIRYHVAKDKEAFTLRLQRNLRVVGECIHATCTLDHNGYPRMTFRYKGRFVVIHVMRIIAILRNCAPIPRGMEVAHRNGCDRRCVLHTELQHYVVNAATNTKYRREEHESPVEA